MLDEKLPDDVAKLRPRKLRLGPDVERLLEGVAGVEVDPKKAGQANGLRPKADSVNAARRAGCGQIEYITREYCRCGHYLAGQIEDEYLAWERNLAETHERLSTEADRKLKPFRVMALAALPFLIWPLLYPVLFDDFGSLTTWLWMLPGIAIFGLFGLIQAIVTAELNDSAQALAAASFEQFLTERIGMPSN
ncbi:hypothetical protein [Qingshengfaniella alkalisoli]|uniref:Uncharacterized protein n=1 Tax=Qingshengfaniella alkalisoli TaxID=2599296 RepID=A0A5B8IUT4_9RHOB|nr:hypothetical protein [Qingshengfaniella alkalisoli]QDY69882.1 hypothetical protein FPZ52_09785 [Qingshengfaniella alkalisoli]